MRWDDIGEKLLNLNKDEKMKIRSLDKIIREKISQVGEEQERKIRKEDEYHMLAIEIKQKFVQDNRRVSDFLLYDLVAKI